MKIAYRAKDILEAEIIKGLLLANGIEAHTSGYYLQGAIGDLSATDFSRVHVHDGDYIRARELLKEYEAQLADQDASPVRSERSGPSYLQKIIITIVVAVAASFLIYSVWM